MTKFKWGSYESVLNDIDNITDEFLRNKIKFLEDKNNNYAEITKKNFWRTFYNAIYEFEKMYNKDLGMFNEEDIRTFIKSQNTNSSSYIDYLKSLLNKYEDWALKTGVNPTYNPCDNLDFKEFAIINKKDLRDKYIKLEDLLQLWEINRTKEFANYQEAALVFLIRLGLKGKNWSEVKYFKLDDIDFDNNCINVTDRNENNINCNTIIKRIKVDKDIIDILLKANEESVYKKKFRGDIILDVEYKESPYLIKVLTSSKDNVIGTTAFRSSIINFFNIIEYNYIPAKNLFKNAEIDMLLEIKPTKKWNKLDTDDFKHVVKFYEGTDKPGSSATKLKDYYASVTKDDDIIDVRLKYDENGNRFF